MISSSASKDGSEVFVFDPAGRHLRTINALTGSVVYEFTYDSDGRLIRIGDADGNITTIQRDATGNPSAIVGPYGQRTSLGLDANGYLERITNPAGEAVRFGYTSDGLLTETTDPRGNTSRYAYDDMGRLIRADDPAGGSQTFSRTQLPTGYEVTRTTALGRTTTYRVEHLSTGDKRLTNTFCCGAQTETLIGTDGSRKITYPDGTVVDVKEGPDPRFGMQSPIIKSFTIGTPRGVRYSATSSRAVTLTDPDNPLSLETLTDTVTVNGRTYTSLYDAATRQVTTASPEGRQTITTLDGRGRVADLHLPGLLPVLFTYDARGHLTTIIAGSGDDARISTINYNVEGYLGTITDPLLRTVMLDDDAGGRITNASLPSGREIRVTYDGNRNVTFITPSGRPSHNFTYTAANMLEKYIPPEVGAGGNFTRYTYDLDRQLHFVTRPDSATIDIGYDEAGRFSTITTPRGLISLTYDPTTGQLTSVTAPDGGAIAYTYDGGLLAQTTWSGAISGAVHRTYDDDFRVISGTINGAHTINFQYDKDGLVTQAGALTLARDPQNGLINGTTLGNVTDTWSHNGFGEPSAYVARYSGTEILAIHYSRDKVGGITEKSETISGVTNTYAYAYDLAGRLTEFRKNGTIVSGCTYDSNGNRLSYTGPDGTVTGSYDNQDRLLQYDNIACTYTPNGELQKETNTKTGQTTTYQYDALSNLTGLTLPEGTLVEYIIDGMNRRIGKKLNGILVQGFLYTGAFRPIVELDGSGNVVARFVYASRVNVPDYMERGGKTYRIISDHLGSPTIVIDAVNGTIAQQIEYDEFGNVVTDTNPGFQPFGFAGGIYDRDTKLTRLGARDYDARTGRWTSKDWIGLAGGDLNRYAYAGSDPVNWYDIDGNVRIEANTFPDTGAGRKLLDQVRKALRKLTGEKGKDDEWKAPPRKLDPDRDFLRDDYEEIWEQTTIVYNECQTGAEAIWKKNREGGYKIELGPLLERYSDLQVEKVILHEYLHSALTVEWEQAQHGLIDQVIRDNLRYTGPPNPAENLI